MIKKSLKAINIKTLLVRSKSHRIFLCLSTSCIFCVSAFWVGCFFGDLWSGSKMKTQIYQKIGISLLRQYCWTENTLNNDFSVSMNAFAIYFILLISSSVVVTSLQAVIQILIIILSKLQKYIPMQLNQSYLIKIFKYTQNRIINNHVTFVS